MIYGGEDIVDDKALHDTTSKDGNNNKYYKVLIRKINTHFMPKQNKDFTRFQLSEPK